MGKFTSIIGDQYSKVSAYRSAKWSRLGMHLLFCTLLLASGYGMIWSFSVWRSNIIDIFDLVTITIFIEATFFTLGFLIGAVLYIAWINNWFDEYAEVQSQAKQFESDRIGAAGASAAATERKAAKDEETPASLPAATPKRLLEDSFSESSE